MSDEFWIDPIVLDDQTATIRASFNGYSVIVLIERSDRQAITIEEATNACNAVAARLPRRREQSRR